MAYVRKRADIFIFEKKGVRRLRSVRPFANTQKENRKVVKEDCMGSGKKFIAILLSVILTVMPAFELAASSLSEAEREKAELEQELKEAQALIDELKDSKDDIESKVRQLDARLTKIESRILSLEEKLEQTNVQIEDTEEQLLEAKQEESIQYERMKYRIKYMYENGRSMSVLEVLLSSESIAEFVSQAEYVRQITNYDREMLKKYQKIQQTIADAKSTLELDYNQMDELKSQVQMERETVQKLLAAKEEELSGIKNDISNAQADADAVSAEIQAQNDIIAQIREMEAKKEAERKAAEEKARQEEEQRRQQQQQANSTEQPTEGTGETGNTPEPILPPEDTYNGGAFVWPCPSSTRVTSDYGNRLSPTAGASSNHKGIDIGADYGSSIVAAADGSVAYAGYNSGMGNYIMISHGSGLYTVYGHCSALLVSTGENVTAGQTIAQVGSTGISTGNHLHFGVSKDGAYVSPWNYLSK